jgi:hypothetical protein
MIDSKEFPILCLYRFIAFVLFRVLRMPPRLLKIVILIANIEEATNLLQIFPITFVTFVNFSEAIIIEGVSQIVKG